MEGISPDTRLVDVFGPPEYNNFNEPVPFSNEPRCLIGFTASFLALSWLFVCFRLYVRLKVARAPGLDDLFVALYLISTSVASIAFIVTTRYGTGRHFLLLTVAEATAYLIQFYIINISLNFATAFIKFSLLFQFLRMFNKGTWEYRLSVVGIVVTTLWGVTFTFLSIYPCQDVRDSWNLFARDARCWGYGSKTPDLFVATLLAHNGINTFLDLYITLIPFQMWFKPGGVTSRTRAGLMVLLLMGATVVTLSVWRVYETIIYQGGWVPTRDPTWYGPKSILLIILEVNVASICASVPIFWPVLRDKLDALHVFVTHEFSVNYESRESSSSLRKDDGDSGTNAHYNDVYIMDLVDPLGSKAGSLARSATGREKDRNDTRDRSPMREKEENV